MSLELTRHRSVFDPHYALGNTPINVIGAGATGSKVIMSLVALGCENINVYDFDVIEAHNIANQEYMQAQVGKPKVEAIAALAHAKSGATKAVISHCAKLPNELIDAETFRDSILFLLVDTWAARKEIMAWLYSTYCLPKWLIETRMASTHGEVHCVRQDHITDFMDSWPDDNDDDQERSPCGGTLSVGPTANLLANHAVWQMMNRYRDPEHFFKNPNSHFTLMLHPIMLMENAS